METCTQHRAWLQEALLSCNDRQVFVSKHHLLFIEKELELRNLLKDEYTTEDMMKAYNPDKF
jgi:hypothetical protein